MNISDTALPWVLGIGGLIGYAIGALLAHALDRRLHRPRKTDPEEQP